MRDAKVRNANLRGADLSETMLDGAVFRHADVTDTNFDHADLFYTTCTFTNFSKAKNAQVPVWKKNVR
jgi:uncharacterized protein YjbI with pentapeptide repeats